MVNTYHNVTTHWVNDLPRHITVLITLRHNVGLMTKKMSLVKEVRVGFSTKFDFFKLYKE